MSDTTPRKPHVLFVMEKWHDHDPQRGPSVSQHNFFGSLETTGLATQEHFAFDEYFHTHGRRADQALLQRCADKRPDLIFLNWLPVPDHMAPRTETLEAIARKLNIPIVSYHTDAVWPGVLEWADTIAPYLSFGVMLDNHSYLQRSRHPGKFISLWAPEDPRIFYSSDAARTIPVSFLGTLDNAEGRPDRWEAMTALKNANLPLLHTGGLREKPISLEEYGRILRTSQISLNFPRSGPHEQAKGRIFEITLSGALMVELENKETPYWFIPGTDYVSYRDGSDLVDKIRHLLTHPQELSTIAQNGYRKATQHYTAKTFWSFILDRATTGKIVATPDLGAQPHMQLSAQTVPSAVQASTSAASPAAPAVNLQRKPKILYVMLEYPNWNDAAHWSLPGPLGFEAGFKVLDIEYLTIPALAYNSSRQGKTWLSHVRELCFGRRFDQVWFEAAHSVYSDDFLDWLTTIAPIRVGSMSESLEYDPREASNNPAGLERRLVNRKRNFPYVTNFLCVDEKDVESFNAAGKQPALWWSSCKMPRRFISDLLPDATQNPGLFFGAIYGDRAAWLRHPALQGLLVRPERSPEDNTAYPTLYQQLMDKTELLLQGDMPLTPEILGNWNFAHRSIREEAYKVWLQGLQWGCANVNLPQFGRMYASRVIEAMAIGRPVISWEIPNRPLTKELFRNGEEILLYSQNNPEELAEHIRHVQRDAQFARNLAKNARAKILRYHTCEGSVGDALQWLETGRVPVFTD